MRNMDDIGAPPPVYGLHAAHEAGFAPIKVNVVVQRGVYGAHELLVHREDRRARLVQETNETARLAARASTMPASSSSTFPSTTATAPGLDERRRRRRSAPSTV